MSAAQVEHEDGWEVGRARCSVCDHTWTAVAPVDRAPVGFECPRCHHFTGDFDGTDRGIGMDEDGE